DFHVTGVQTCALPISFNTDSYASALEDIRQSQPIYGNAFILCANKAFGFDQKHRNHLALLEYIFKQDKLLKNLLAVSSLQELFRSEERRVGKELRSRW